MTLVTAIILWLPATGYQLSTSLWNKPFQIKEEYSWLCLPSGFNTYLT